MDIFKILLILHIAGGGTSLLLGLYVLIAKKGDKLHKLLGNIFSFSMLMAALVALPMSYLHPNYFLFIIGVFTSYMLLTGKQYLKIKDISCVDNTAWFLAATMLIFGLAFIVMGIYNLIKSNTFGIVFLVFGFISLFFVAQDYNNFKGKSKVKNFGLTTHIQRMIGSYIASVTAFIVVNNKILPDVLAWLLPTVLFVPLIIKWTNRYKIDIK